MSPQRFDQIVGFVLIALCLVFGWIAIGPPEFFHYGTAELNWLLIFGLLSFLCGGAALNILRNKPPR